MSNESRVFKIYHDHKSSHSLPNLNNLPDGVVRRDFIFQPNKLELIPVSEFKPQEHCIQRAGVIVYDYDHDMEEFNFYMGVDNNSKEFTDFGGGSRKNQNPVNSALREFAEESYKVFGVYHSNQVQNCLMTCSKGMAIIFIPLYIDYDFCKNKFNSIYKYEISKGNKVEICDIIKLNSHQFIQQIFAEDSNMYIIVRKFLQKMLVDNINFLNII